MCEGEPAGIGAAGMTRTAVVKYSRRRADEDGAGAVGDVAELFLAEGNRPVDGIGRQGHDEPARLAWVRRQCHPVLPLVPGEFQGAETLRATAPGTKAAVSF